MPIPASQSDFFPGSRPSVSSCPHEMRTRMPQLQQPKRGCLSRGTGVTLACVSWLCHFSPHQNQWRISGWFAVEKSSNSGKFSIVTSHEPVGSLGQDDTLPRQLQTSCTSASLHEETQADYESNNLGCKDPATSTSASYSRSVSSHALLPIGSTATGSRIGPFSIDAQSPPPSPGIAQVLLELCPLDEDPTRRASVDTPPPSRRASLPSVLVRETPPLIGDINVSSEVHELPISTVSSTSESRFSDPFVGTPYVKPPIYIDYGVSLKIAASTFVNRNFTVVDSPAGTYSIGERCLIGPNVTLAGVGHPLGTYASIKLLMSIGRTDMVFAGQPRIRIDLPFSAHFLKK